MFAIITTGGKQYKVEPGLTLRIEKLEGVAGGEIVFDNVLLVVDGDKAKIGTPTVANAKVTAKLVEQGRAKKIDVIKYKPKVRYKRKYGHRQPFTEVEIVSIT
ncbi:MAG: 50S ribosomal protein L21 [bacterium]|nr:50S ribosomal protein L21 [bacterium]